ncbi:putative transmembrane protein 116-like [Scophthalmus maximus]|uniref:Putative transmembrane protein 116-like n=1 Tax=Scophthalmus maximus TaxID=52904 RepID=A0A2U9BYR5_SCOMX|nr:putative transmembrane protein 116-like [Scophthalmus maximus]
MELNGILSLHQIDVLTTVYLVLLTPSLIGSFSVLLVSIVRRRHLKQQVHLLVQLALADLLAALVLMSTSVMNKVVTNSNEIICQYSLPLSLTFYFISFLLVVVYAWKSKNAIQGWRARPADDEGGQSQCRRKIVDFPVYAIVWLIPITIYLSYVLTHFIKTTQLIPDTDRSLIVHNESTYSTRCILFLHVWTDSRSDPEIVHDTFIKSFLFLVVIPVMLSCSVIYYNVGKWYERHQHQGLFPVEGDGRSRRRFKRVFSTARNMVMVILFCWAPALVLILLSTLMKRTNVEQQVLFGLYMIQAASVSLQGFLNSMVYAWRRPNFTEAVLGENTPLVAYARLAFFDESLRSSS